MAHSHSNSLQPIVQSRTRNGKPRLACLLLESSTSALYEHSCVCTVLDKPESREMTDQIDRREEATLTSGFRLGRSEVLRSLRHYLWTQSQGHHIIDRPEERGAERGRSCLKCREWAIVNWLSLKLFERQRWGNLWETMWRRASFLNGLFRAYRCDLTELNSNPSVTRAVSPGRDIQVLKRRR